MSASAQPTFAAVAVGDVACSAEFGPLTIDDTVHWGASQEIWERLHFDREFAREHSGQRSFIASGAYRQALLARMLTDWIGPRGVLRKLRVRHTAPTVEGDFQRYTATVVEKSTQPDDPWIACDIEGKNQDGTTIVVAHGVVTLPVAAR